MKPKDLVEIKILDIMSLNDQSCPVCELINESTEKLIHTILYEFVNDPQIRSSLRTMGFCKKHAQMIEEHLQKHPELGLLGIAIIYEDMLDQSIKILQDGEFSALKVENCYLCEREEQTEKIYINSFGKILSDVEGMTLFSQNNFVFCLDHFIKIYQLVDETARRRFKEIQIEKLSRLKDLLTIFIDKHDYRNREPFGKEATVYKLADKLLAKPLNLNNRRNHRWRLWKNLQEK